MLATVTGVFRIANHIELRYTASGTAIAELSLVNNSKYKGRDGNYIEESCFVTANIFGKGAEIINQYCKKGSKIFVVGELRQNTWVDNNNQKKSKHTININSFEFLDKKEQNNTNQQQNNTNQQQNIYSDSSSQNEEQGIDISSEDIPF